MVQLPSPSTAGSLRTITFFLAIRLVPIDKATVKATGRPSGMAETPTATIKKKIFAAGIPSAYPTKPSIIQTTSKTILIILEKDSIRLIRGGFSDSVVRSESAIWPISVSAAVAVTTPVPLPFCTVVAAKAMFKRSPIASASPPFNTSVFLLTATDSPVSRASSTDNSITSISRKSAGTLNPYSNNTTSPGTNCSESI